MNTRIHNPLPQSGRGKGEGVFRFLYLNKPLTPPSPAKMREREKV